MKRKNRENYWPNQNRRQFRRELVQTAGNANRDKTQDASTVGYCLSSQESQPRIPRSFRQYATKEALKEYDRQEKEETKAIFDFLHGCADKGICPGCEGPYEHGRTGYIYCPNCREED
jgi:hypothetical protein